MKTVHYNRLALQNARKNAGLSQAQAAKLMSMARTTIVAIEQGKRGVTQDELNRFADIYGFSTPEDLQADRELVAAEIGRIHIYLGYRAGISEKGEQCFYCGTKKVDHFAYTYFGAPVCGVCWDTKWRETEDGQTDPPFADIKNAASGYWI